MVLGAAFALTGLVTYYAARSTSADARRQFDAASEQVHSEIETRLEAYVALLRGGAGLFAASERVTRAQFKAFVDRLRVPESYPGAQGIGFSLRLRGGEEAELVA